MQSSDPANERWFCIQQGHRERYSIPRALDRVGTLRRLITDTWIPPRSLANRLAVGPIGRRLRDRYHSELPASKVRAFSASSFRWEALARLRRWGSTERVLRRNQWWSRLAARALTQDDSRVGERVFSYSYDALEVFAVARERSVVPVLGQIDPGPFEDRKVTELVRKWSDYRTSFQPGSAEYYRRWRAECSMASYIVVNSLWSREALIQEGIDAEKIGIHPLVYQPPVEAAGWRKTYPATFTAHRPLRVLFLGQCILRKGIAEVIEAARILADEPVEFIFVGNTDISDLTAHFGRARIWYYSRVSRSECHRYYRDADVFLFPTHSDGFGLTQLEAQAWGLPILASRCCATVVEPQATGELLSEVTVEAIVAALRPMLRTPELLARYSAKIQPYAYGLKELGDSLVRALTERDTGSRNFAQR